MSDLVVLNQLGPEVAVALAAHPTRPHVIESEPGPTPALAEAEILITSPHPRWATAPDEPPDFWPGGLGWVQVASTGVDWFPRWLFDGPVVTCGRGHNAAAIAEYVLASILLREKRLDEVSIRSADQWQRHSLGTLEGRVLGLAGYGAIGRAIAARARPFGMRIAAWRRRAWSDETAADLLPAASLAELASLSDHLVLALPLTDATRGCVDAGLLAHAKPGSHLINVARGGLVDQAALLAALDDGQLGFATLDVTDPEPLPAGHPLYVHPQVRLTPHLSWSGGQGRVLLVEQILRNLSAYANGTALADIVDPAERY